MAKSVAGKSVKKSPRTSAKRAKLSKQIPVKRVQLGVRLERSMVKVLKAMAEYGDMSLGELLEDIVLHSFEGGSAQIFGADDIKVIADFKRVYGMKYDVHSNYRFIEKA